MYELVVSRKDYQFDGSVETLAVKITPVEGTVLESGELFLKPPADTSVKLGDKYYLLAEPVGTTITIGTKTYTLVE